MERLTRTGVEAEQTALNYMDMEVKMEHVSDNLLELILNGPTINSVTKNILRHMIRHLYTKLKLYEDTGLTPEQVAAMKQELIDERYRHDRLQDFEVAEAQDLARVKAERDAAIKDIDKCCANCARSYMNNSTGETCPFAVDCDDEYPYWIWRGAEDTKEATT